MSLKFIRDMYGVPAKRGAKICYTDEGGMRFYGRITSSRCQYLRVLVDEKHSGARKRILLLHPTYKVEYL